MKVYCVFQEADDPYSGGDWLISIFSCKEDADAWISGDEHFYVAEYEVQ